MNAPLPLSCPIDVLHISAANPDFFVLRVLCDEETGYPFDIEKVPVLCWAIERASYAAYPITPEGVHLEPAYIQYPHGTVECVGVDIFGDAGALLAGLQRQHSRGHA